MGVDHEQCSMRVSPIKRPSKKRGTRWLFFWENILLPLNLLMGTVWLIIDFQVVSLLILLLIAATIVCLKKRNLWGWYLNFILLVTITLNYPFYLHGKKMWDYDLYKQGHDVLVKIGERDPRESVLLPPEFAAEDFFLPFGIAAVMILLPSAIYFGKRKYLFEGSVRLQVGSHAEIESPSIRQISEALMAQSNDSSPDGVELRRSSNDWIYYVKWPDGGEGIEYCQGKGSIYHFEGPVDYDTLVDVFSKYAIGDDSWKKQFEWPPSSLIEQEPDAKTDGGRKVEPALEIEGVIRRDISDEKNGQAYMPTQHGHSENTRASPKPSGDSVAKQQDHIIQTADSRDDAAVSSRGVDSHLDSGTQPILLGRLEECANCNRIIGKLEQSYDFKGHVVCVHCYGRLKEDT